MYDLFGFVESSEYFKNKMNDREKELCLSQALDPSQKIGIAKVYKYKFIQDML